MTTTTRSTEYRGVSIEAAEEDGCWYATVGGTEVRRTFPTVAHALNYARRRVDSQARRGRGQVGDVASLPADEEQRLRSLIRG